MSASEHAAPSRAAAASGGTVAYEARSPVLRIVPAVVAAAALAALAWNLSTDPAQRQLVVSLVAGSLLGVVLQRGRFCFLCNLRDLVEGRDARGVVSILVALAAGVVLYAAVIMAWVPVPQPGKLPPNAHVGPVGPVLAFAAFVFGIGMALAGSCLSAHFYRLGEGSLVSIVALVCAFAGFLLGFLTWNPLYLLSVAESVPLWLPHHLGHAGAVAAALALLGLLLFVVLRLERRDADADAPETGLAGAGRALFQRRWPPLVTGLLVGTISSIYYLRVAPLGVTAELGSLARTAGASVGIIPDTLHGLDTLRGCATVIKQAILSNNGLLVLGIVAGSFAAASASGQFRPVVPTAGKALRAALGGVLMGWGAMTALGCTVGVLLSGIHAGAVSGWVFLAFCTLGVLATWKVAGFR